MKRLFDDPRAPRALRDDLLRSSAAGQDYPVEHKLPQLQAALVDPARAPLGEATGVWKPLSWRAVPAGWKLVALLTLGGAGALLVRPADKAAPTSAETASARSRAPDPDSQPSAAAEGSRSSASAEGSDGSPLSSAEVPSRRLAPPPMPETTSPSSATSGPAAASAARAAPRPLAAKPTSSSRREIAQLARVRALLEQDPRAAYRLAQRSEREFPGGLLGEERQALSIIALHKSGKREAAAAQARAFFARFPESPMREVVEAELLR